MVFLARKVKLSNIIQEYFVKLNNYVVCISLQGLPAKLGKLKSEELIIDGYDEVGKT